MMIGDALRLLLADDSDAGTAMRLVNDYCQLIKEQLDGWLRVHNEAMTAVRAHAVPPGTTAGGGKRAPKNVSDTEVCAQVL
jgi:hypothetical protein